MDGEELLLSYGSMATSEFLCKYGLVQLDWSSLNSMDAVPFWPQPSILPHGADTSAVDKLRWEALRSQGYTEENLHPCSCNVSKAPFKVYATDLHCYREGEDTEMLRHLDLFLALLFVEEPLLLRIMDLATPMTPRDPSAIPLDRPRTLRMPRNWHEIAEESASASKRRRGAALRECFVDYSLSLPPCALSSDVVEQQHRGTEEAFGYAAGLLACKVERELLLQWRCAITERFSLND